MPPKRVLLNCKVAVNAAVLRPIVSWLRRDHNIALHLTSHWRGEHRFPRSLIDALPRSHRIYRDVTPIISPLASRRHWDLLLSPDMKMAGARRARHRVHTFHGISPKGASISPQAMVYDSLFLFGEYHRQRFIEKGIAEEGDPRLEMIGFPKVDCLVDDSIDRAAVVQSLGFEKGKKIVLYAPTWRGTSLDAAGDQIVETLAGLDVQVIVKLHDHSLNPRLAKRGWARRLADWGARDNVAVWDDPDICPAMIASDLLVTDFSSVANEYTLLDRPIIHFDPGDLLQHYSEKQIDHAMLERRPGVTVDRADALPEAVTHALEHPDELSAERRGLARHLFHRPGSATHRAVRRIYEILEIDPFLPTKWAIDAAMREADAREAKAQEDGEDLMVIPFAERGRYPGQAKMT